MADQVELNRAFSSLRRRLNSLPGIDNETAFVRSAVSVLEENWRFAGPDKGDAALSAAEAEGLAIAGVRDGTEASKDPIFRPVAAHALLVTTAVPLRAAAKHLGVGPSRLRQRLRDRSLIGVRLSDRRSWGIPSFQLTDHGELPGLRTVIRALRPDIRPVQVFAFFTTAQADLLDEKDKPMTPRDWLLSGGDPEPVAELAQYL